MPSLVSLPYTATVSSVAAPDVQAVFDPSVDGGNRVRKQDVGFALWRTADGFASWIPLCSPSALVVSAGRDDVVQAVLCAVSQCRGFASSARVAVFGFASLAGIPPSPLPFRDMVDRLSVLRREVLSAARAMGQVEPSNRRLVVPVVVTGPDTWRLLPASVVGKFASLCADSGVSRIHPMVVHWGDVSDIPDDVVSASSWLAFTGGTAMSGCSRVFPTVVSQPASPIQPVVGFVVDRAVPDRCVPVHPLVYTVSGDELARRDEVACRVGEFARAVASRRAVADAG